MIVQTEQNLEKIPEKVKWSFDSGYDEGENLKYLIDKKIDGYIPSQRNKIENRYDKSNFIYDKEKDAYVCPEGKSLIIFAKEFDITKNKWFMKYRGEDCENCMRQKECTKTKDGKRIVKRDPYDENGKGWIRKCKCLNLKKYIN